MGKFRYCPIQRKWSKCDVIWPYKNGSIVSKYHTLQRFLIFRMDSNPFAQLAKKSKCEAPVELHNVVQAVFKITMDMEDQKEVVVLPNLMGQG